MVVYILKIIYSEIKMCNNYIALLLRTNNQDKQKKQNNVSIDKSLKCHLNLRNIFL